MAVQISLTDEQALGLLDHAATRLDCIDDDDGQDFWQAIWDKLNAARIRQEENRIRRQMFG